MQETLARWIAQAARIMMGQDGITATGQIHRTVQHVHLASAAVTIAAAAKEVRKAAQIAAKTAIALNVEAGST